MQSFKAVSPASALHRGVGRLVIRLDTPKPLLWRIRRLHGDAREWTRGFPYFGDASELLDAWGLYSRCVALRILKAHGGLTLGDELRHRLVINANGEPTLYIADLSCRRLHCLRPR